MLDNKGRDVSYIGDEIEFIEMPYGCEILTKDGKSIVIKSPKDAEALSESLERMVMIWCQKDMMNNIDKS